MADKEKRPLVKAGRLYEVTMRGEPDFGGTVNVLFADSKVVVTRFEIGDWVADDILTFFPRRGRLYYNPSAHDAFPPSAVEFKEVGS